MVRRQRRPTLFPYTTLFRSGEHERAALEDRDRVRAQLARTALLFTARSEEHTSELQSLRHLVCRLLLEKKSSCRPSAARPPGIEDRTGMVRPHYLGLRFIVT